MQYEQRSTPQSCTDEMLQRRKWIVLLLLLLILLLVVLKVPHPGNGRWSDSNLRVSTPASVAMLVLQETKPSATTTGSGSRDYATATVSRYHSSHAEKLSGQCMAAAHLNTSNLTVQAKSNANYLYNEFRRVIPENSLRGYKSHCWKTSFHAQWKRDRYNGIIGNISFRKNLSRNSPRRLMTTVLTKKFPTMRYESSLSCLPNLYLLGFPKCGSSFFYCILTKLVSMKLFNSTVHTLNAEKEPHFWVSANAAGITRLPKSEDIGGYLMNFLPGFGKIYKRHDGILVDGTPNSIFNWPRFRTTEPDIVNYCLLPSVLPTLFPNSKFVVIMRNPLHMLYSAFWFSCTMTKAKFPHEALLKGPDLFHTRISTKIDNFNRCMTDPSIPSIQHVCEMNEDYGSCIQQRLHMLEKCVYNITHNLFSPEMPDCGRSRLAMGMFYVHIKKWLSVIPNNRFFFLTLENLTSSFENTVKKLFEFLDFGEDIPSPSKLQQIKDSCAKNSQSLVNYKHNPVLQMRSDTTLLLQQFYKPFNDLLSNLLDKKDFLWL